MPILAENPRRIYKDYGREKIYSYLQIKGNYVPQARPLKAFCNSLWRYTPLLLEGERGCGKTALPEAVQAAFKLKMFYLQCHSAVKVEDVLGEWDRPIQDFAAKEMRAEGMETQKIRDRLLTKEFFNFGEILQAFEYAADTKETSVLCIDEIDKLDEKGEDFLLQILARGFARVPRMVPDNRVGFLPEFDAEHKFQSFPIVVLTSNNMRSGVSSPLRSRCRYAYVKSPTQHEMVEIILTRVEDFAKPENQTLFLQFVRLIDSIGSLSLQEKPALREFIELAETICHSPHPVKEITADLLDNNFDTLAKSEKDIEVFEKRISGLLEDARMDNKPLINGVRRGGEYFTAETLVGELLDRRYQMANNLDKFVAHQ